MTNSLIPVAVSIGLFLVYLNNRKTEKKLKDHFENKRRSQPKSYEKKR